MESEYIQMPTNEIDYSIVVPVYFNEGSLFPLLDMLREKVISQNPQLTCEVIFVDDGSKDNSLKELLDLREKNPGLVKVIKLTRNFGQLSAITAGYHYAKGKCVINMAADLQDPPELINQMLHAHFREKFEIVIGTRESRDDSFFIRKTSEVFYTLIQKLSFPNMPTGGFDFALISSKVKDSILQRQEVNSFWQGQLLWTGYSVKFIPYQRSARKTGKSRWSVAKKIKYLIDGVTSYSYFPLRLMSVIGSLIALFGFVFALIIIYARFFGDVPFTGWAPIMVAVLVLSGIQMLMIGIVGEYLWRVLDQVKNRPPFLIERIYDQEYAGKPLETKSV